MANLRARILIPVMVFGLALAASSLNAGASQSFDPTLDIALANPGPSAHSDVSSVVSVSSGMHVLGTFGLNTPVGWEVARDTAIPTGDVVAYGSMSLDVDCNSTVDNFSFFVLTNQPADPQATGEWTGQITSWWFLTVTVDGNSSQGFDMSADLTNLTEFHTLCTPQTFSLTFLGRSNPGNAVVMTNPSSQDSYVWTSPLISLGGEHTTQATDTVCVCITPDSDSDGVIDETNCGSDPADPNKRPERIDGAFAGVDDDGDTQVDEPLPSGSALYDCDGDGFKGSDEDHVFGPAARGDQKACGSNGWPADVASGPFSSNRIDIQDLASFVSPVRHLDSDPGDPGYDVRWDVVPGSFTPKDIDSQDISRLSTFVPPMLGVKAFNGPPCPWPSPPLSDIDLDGVADEVPCGSDHANPYRRPERTDGAFAGVDDDGDTQVDEPLPPGSENYDCDGDGWTGSQEKLIFSAGGTANDQDPCGSDGWPADLAGNNNLLNIGDLNSFINPSRPDDGHGTFNKFNHPLDDDGDTVIEQNEDPPSEPGVQAYNLARWNLQLPPHLPATIINSGDLNTLNPGVTAATSRPPMFAGQPAFFTNGGQCPWPP